jgi:hypothetical protein
MAMAMREEVLHHGWMLAVRVAVVASLLAACLGAALYRFTDVSPVAIVVGTMIAGLAIGLRLPPARPGLAPRRR